MQRFDRGTRAGNAPIHDASDALKSPETVPGCAADSAANCLSLAATASGPTQRNRAYCRNVARLGAEAADALDHAHGLGILHRDIKPANLLIDPHGALWITDFGLARFPSDLSLTHTGDMVGTLRYMSPEQAQARGGVVDQRTDIYALGVTLYELLTLQPAFNGRDHQELLRQIALDEPVSPRRLNPAVPRDLETIVLKAIAKDPASRYTTAQELAADLRRFMDDQPILARRPGPLERSASVGPSAQGPGRHGRCDSHAGILRRHRHDLVPGAQDGGRRSARRRGAPRKDAFIIESYPLLDRLGIGAIGEANSMLYGQAGSTTAEEASQIFEQALSVFQQAIELPPTDLKSREIIARAYTRLGYSRWMLSMAKAARGVPAAAAAGRRSGRFPAIDRIARKAARRFARRPENPPLPG